MATTTAQPTPPKTFQIVRAGYRKLLPNGEYSKEKYVTTQSPTGELLESVMKE